MRLRIALLGGQLLEFEVDTTKDKDEPAWPFGFSNGGSTTAQVEVAEDRRPLQERPND